MNKIKGKKGTLISRWTYPKYVTSWVGSLFGEYNFNKIKLLDKLVNVIMHFVTSVKWNGARVCLISLDLIPKVSLKDEGTQIYSYT